MLPGDYYGESLTWFVGRVELVNRNTNIAKVRIFGIHTLDKTLISTNDLPDAIIVQNDKASGSSMYLDPGNVVTGFFLDGRSAQMPVITGRIAQSIEGGNFGDRPQGGFRPQINGEASPKQTSVPDQGPDRPGIPAPDRQTVAQQAYNFFRSKFDGMGKSGDWGHMITSTVLGSIQKESQFDPNIGSNFFIDENGNRRPEGKTGAYGLHQWLNGRLIGQRGLKTLKPNSWPTAQGQIEFIWWEFNNTEHSAFRRLKNSSTLAEACDAMAAYGRGYKEWIGRVNREGTFQGIYPWKQRYGYANQIYTKKWDLEKHYQPITNPSPSVPGDVI